MVTVVIQQPTYLPWMGYFELIARSDVFVFLDSVQFERRSWQSRNRLRSVAGQPFWLTVPVEKAPREARIKEIQIMRQDRAWVRKHTQSIQTSLGKAKHFHAYRDVVEQWTGHDMLMLADLNIALITDLARILGFSPTFVRSSDLVTTSAKAELMVEIARQVNATRYYSAVGSSAYLRKDMFEEHGMTVAYQDWPHPVYAQCGPGFVSHLSIIDALTNLGPEETRRLILAR